MLHSKHGQLTHNARPVQELSGRPVWYNVGGYAVLNSPNIENNSAVRFDITIFNIFTLVLCCKFGTAIFFEYF